MSASPKLKHFIGRMDHLERELDRHSANTEGGKKFDVAFCTMGTRHPTQLKEVTSLRVNQIHVSPIH